MQAHDIETYLADLGQELQHSGVRQPIRILLVGGAYMVTQAGNRPATNDVDILLMDTADTSTWPLHPTFQAAVRAVAARRLLPTTWLNDVIGDALRNNGPVPPGAVWRAHGMPEVYIPPSEYILALKLLAGRPRDIGDIQALGQQLGIHSRDQAQQVIDRYIPDGQLQQLNQVDMTLAQCFP